MPHNITRDNLIRKMHDNQVRLVEALPAESYYRCHIPGAENIMPGDVKAQAEAILPNKNAEIVVYCGNST